jgi:hypothetical protein
MTTTRKPPNRGSPQPARRTLTTTLSPLLLGEPPWRPLAIANPFALFMHVLSHAALTPPLDAHAALARDRDPALRALVERAFTRDSAARPTAAELLADPALEKHAHDHDG